MAATMTSVVKPAEETGGNFVTRMPWYLQMGILLILVLLLIFAADAMLYSDTRAQTVKVQEQIQALKATNAQAEIIRQNLQATELILKEKREEINSLRDLLPDQVELSRVYDNIHDYMKETRLQLNRFAPMTSVPSEFYTAQPIQVEVLGTYDNLGAFFSKLGFYTRIVSVSEVDVRQAGDSAQEGGKSIASSFIITAYYISQDNLDKLTMKKPAAPAAAPVKK